MAGNKRTWISPLFKEKIVRGYHDNKLTVSELAKRHNCAYNTVDKIVKTTKYGFWGTAAGRDVKLSVTEVRKNLPATERLMLLQNDATEVVELILRAMRIMLSDHPASYSLPQLASMFSAVAPYGIYKYNDKRNEKESPKVDLFKMFKDNIANKQNNGNNQIN